MSALISVIVPVYNAGSYLEPLIDSVLNQTWDNLELILVDDGSTDGSAAVCDHASQRDSRVHVIHKENGGQSSARNVGLENAAGEYIAFADHDDLLHPHIYESMMEAMARFGTSVCACDFQNVQQKDIDSISLGMENPEASVLECDEWLSGLFRPTWRTPIWNKLYHKSVLDGIRFGNYRLGEDNLFSYQVIKRARRTSFVHKTLYFQRMHGENFEFTGIKYFTDLLHAKELILKDVELSFPAEKMRFRKLFLYECIRIYNAYVECNDNQYEMQRKDTVNLLKHNAKGLWMSDMPIGHKLLFTKLRVMRSYENIEKIVI